MKLSDPTRGLRKSDLEKVALRGEALDDHRTFWEESARVDALHAVADQASEENFASTGVPTAEKLAALAGPSGRLLEVGCGIGRLMGPLAAMTDDDGRPRFEVHGIDISSEMLRRAQERLADNDNVVFHHGNGYDLGDLDDGAYDLVYSEIAVQHMPKTIALNYFKEMHRVLRLGGRCRLQVPNILLESHVMEFNHFSQPYFVEHPYPMNFYGPFEIVRLLNFAGFWVWDVDHRMVVLAAKVGVPGAPRPLGRRLAEMACRLTGLEL